MYDILMYIMAWIYLLRPQLINVGEQAICLKFNQYNKHVKKKNMLKTFYILNIYPC